MTELSDVGALVAALPEKYQPIFGHPELSDGSSRSCEDRLVLIRECAHQMQSVLGRPLRVLDLGCAQGFFSLSLAADGHEVRGVDFLDLNVNVCQALAAEQPALKATFEHGTIEDVIERLQLGDHDLVLGLSVFHHLVHIHGIARVVELCRRLSEVAAASIYELARREEPLYWAPSLPADPAELLAGYPFLRVLSTQATHLSSVARPLYFASSQLWYVAQEMGEFISWSDDSHVRGRGTHKHSRRYFYSEQTFVKKMTLLVEDRVEINKAEFRNEVAFLRNPPADFPAPKLIAAVDNSPDMFLARGMIEGRLISDLIDSGMAYDGEKVVEQVLDQLAILEQAGLYHNDVRCWNVLLASNGQATLIDYGAVSADARDCSWLEDLVLSFLVTIQEIIGRRIFSSNPGRAPVLDFTSLPPRYQNAFIQFFSRGASSWTFAALRACIAEASDAAPELPNWMPIYHRLQSALTSYDRHLGALFEVSEHQRVELQAQTAALELAHSRERIASERSSAVTAELAAASAELDAAKERVGALEEDAVRFAAWAEGLEARILASDADRERLEERALTLDAECQRREARIAELESDKSCLLLLVDELTSSRSHDRQLLKLAQDVEVTNADKVGASQARVRELEAALQLLQVRLHQMQTSRSWRLTAPLRWFTARMPGRRLLGAALRRIRGQGRIGRASHELGSPAEAALEKRVAAVDQIGSRVRKAKH